MPEITLPDGSRRSYPQPVTVAEIAASIGAGLARAALAGRVDGLLVDTSHRVEGDTSVAIVTAKDAEGVEILRHSTAHLLAHAVKELYPEAQVTIGPVIQDGFYYDFSWPAGFNPDDLAAIEQRMREIAARDLPVRRRVMPRDEAVAFFRERGEAYKAEIIAAIPDDQDISLYEQGDFTDLCRGPHVPSTGQLKVFRLMKVAGAFWRGDAKNEMLQRIYGTAWATQKELDDHLHRLEEAERRDHRRLGRQLGLFHFQDEAPGSVYWHPGGWFVFRTLLEYMRGRQAGADYVEVNTPDVMDRSLWERSGHWEHYRENMFLSRTEADEDRIFALKPMNCPGSVSLFKQGVRSYRDLPVRMGEFGKVHRFEPSGALHGLLRLRHFTQDDAHIFCTEAQMAGECRAVAELTLDIYRDFGFDEVEIKLSTRPDQRIGDDAIWDRLESTLQGALDAMGVAYTISPGEGAFYGPKLEFVLRDAIGRHWQCGTLQVDMNLPERFDIHYVAEDNTRQRPVMLHRAFFGSLERFIGILIEHFAGALPPWLAPVQARVLTITDSQHDYAGDVVARLREMGVRADADLRSEKIGHKIREHAMQKLPYLLVVGKKEAEHDLVAVRARGGNDLGAMTVPEFAERLQAEVALLGRSAPTA